MTASRDAPPFSPVTFPTRTRRCGRRTGAAGRGRGAGPDGAGHCAVGFCGGGNQGGGFAAAETVSATRVATAPGKLPFAISGLTGDFGRETGARELYDYVRYLPGVTGAATEGITGNSQVVIRGFRNDVPQRNGFPGDAFVDAIVIERVEVMRGPASLLFGRLTPGGTVNYITKTPRAGRWLELTQQIGSDDFYRTELDANTSLGDGRGRVRVGAAREQAPRAWGNARSRMTTVAPVVAWQSWPGALLTFDYQHYSRDDRAPAVAKPLTFTQPGNVAGGFYPLPKDFNGAADADWRDTETQTFRGELNQLLGTHWRARLNYVWGKRSFGQLLTGETAAVIAPTGLAALTRPVRYDEVSGDGGAWQGEIVGFFERGGVKWRPLAGVLDSTLDGDQLQRELPAALRPAPWDLRNPATWNRATGVGLGALTATPLRAALTERSRAYYAAQTFTAWQERLIFVGGVRRSEVRNRLTSTVLQNVTLPTPIVANFTAWNTSAQAGAGLAVTPRTMVYANYSESFQPQSRFLRVNSLPAKAATPLLGAGWEAGVKFAAPAAGLTTTIAAFEIEQRGRVQTFTTFRPPTTFLINEEQSGRDRSRGVEWETSFEPAAGWQIYGSLTVNDVVVTANPAAPALVGTHPENTARTLAGLVVRRAWAKGRLAGAYVMAATTYTGRKVLRADSPNVLLPAVALLDLTVGYAWRAGPAQMRASLSGRNVTDREYFPSNRARGLPAQWVASTGARW
ncbi:MAG: hypothetical protein B9S34_09005 [Opitutia bacterium Tous-C1TDCM]|nr:MAG: hypothetical protein B9S34_09005 [Opitutae bacterium Tous-C1TDCM]